MPLILAEILKILFTLQFIFKTKLVEILTTFLNIFSDTPLDSDPAMPPGSISPLCVLEAGGQGLSYLTTWAVWVSHIGGTFRFNSLSLSVVIWNVQKNKRQSYFFIPGLGVFCLY